VATEYFPHPALNRFMHWHDPQARMLLVRAAPGTGRTWFGHSWIGDRNGEIHDFSSKTTRQLVELGGLVRRLTENPQLHVVVILSPGHSLWHVPLETTVALAEQRDLLLRPEEIHLLLSTLPGHPEAKADAIFAQSGGWLSAVRVLASYPEQLEAASQRLRGALATWLAHRDPDAELSATAYLTAFDDQTLSSFYGQLVATSHTQDELIQSGLIHEDPERGWFMPRLIRQLLVERVASEGSKWRANCEAAALDSIVLLKGVTGAAELLVEYQWWPGLKKLLSEHWDQLFIQDPRLLRSNLKRLPAGLIGTSRHLSLGIGLLDRVISGPAGPPIPHVAVDYRTDKLAQKLRHQTERLFVRPDSRAISVGLLEMIYLRLSGLYEAAAESALRLQVALQQAMAGGMDRPVMASIVSNQIGITQYLAESEVPAVHAFEFALEIARSVGDPFLCAEPLGKLSLVHALNGQRETAREYLAEHGKYVDNARWGKAMLERSAILASAYLALGDLDIQGSQTELSRLPATVDTDEFWAVHVYLLSMEMISSSFTAAAAKQVYRLRRQRPVAAQAPLARKLLDDVLVTVALVDRTYLPQEVQSERIDPTLIALKHFAHRATDEAVSVLDDIDRNTYLRNGGNLVSYLKIVARNPQGPNEEQLVALKSLHAFSGSLYEISLLRMIPGWEELPQLLELDAEAASKFGAVTDDPIKNMPVRPTLTPREREVLSYLRTGLSRKEIAAKTFRSENTIKTQIKSLYRKVGAGNLQQMLETARILGL